MGLKVQLIKGKKVILEFPLDIEEWQPEVLKQQLEEFEIHLPMISELHDILSNETRMRMLCEMVKTSDCRFSDFMECLDANQKIISESLHRMIDNELVERIERRRRDIHYTPSNLGFASLLTSIFMRKIIDELESK